MYALLNLLADGQFHSGEALGEALGVSRAAIWKQLQQIEQLGVQVDSVKGKGYQLAGGMELLDQVVIAAQLSTEANRELAQIAIVFNTDSTNVEVQKLPSNSVCFAERQTAGRGRLGRHWVSPFARNLYFSIRWRFHQGAAAVEGLSLAVGVCVRRAIAQQTGVSVGLKWPNDVLFQGKKLAGILLEMVGDPTGQCDVIVGIGINVSMPVASAESIDQPWTDVSALCDSMVSRNRLAANLLNELVPLLSTYEKDGFAPWRSEWMAADINADQPVTLILPNRRVEGVARGVAANGALRLETAAGVEIFNGGEVSVRALSGGLHDS